MRLAPNWTTDPAWDNMNPRLKETSQRTLQTIANRYGGALIGPTPLTRTMIHEHGIGHASTLEALAALTAHDLLHARETPQGPAFWIPDRLITTQRATPRRTPRRNGASTSATFVRFATE